MDGSKMRIVVNKMQRRGVNAEGISLTTQVKAGCLKKQKYTRKTLREKNVEARLEERNEGLG